MAPDSSSDSSPTSTQVLWKGLAIGPNSTIRKLFALPDGNRLLQRVDGVATGVEGRCAMRRGDRNQHARLADEQPSETVHNRHLAYTEESLGLLAQLAHLFQRHLLIGLVVE